MSQISANIAKSKSRSQGRSYPRTERSSYVQPPTASEILMPERTKSHNYIPVLVQHRGMMAQMSRKSPDGGIPEPVSVRGEKPRLFSGSPTNSLPISKLTSRPLSRMDGKISESSSQVEIKSKAFKSLAQPTKRQNIASVNDDRDGLQSERAAIEFSAKKKLSAEALLAETADFEQIEKNIQESEANAYLSPSKKQELAMLNEMLKERKKSFLGEIAVQDKAKA